MLSSPLHAHAAAFSLGALDRTHSQISPYIVHTPTVPWVGRLDDDSGMDELHIKLELLQRTGSFKVRGALNTLMSLNDTGCGVTAFSAGNHAIATAYAARTLGIPARVVMPRSANPFRIARCRAEGADIDFGETIGDLLSITERLQAEGYVLVHPFEGRHTIAGTATVGLELCRDLAGIDVVIVPVGGGGLIAGVATAVKQLQPTCRVIGVEPMGACGMSRSLEQGCPLETVEIDTIADSLGAPLHLPLSFALIQRHVDRIVQVTDDQLRAAMRRCFTDMKLAVEPALAAGVAALEGPLAEQLKGQRIALVGCGSNIDIATWQRLIA